MTLFTSSEKKDFNVMPIKDGTQRKRYAPTVKEKARQLVNERKATRAEVATELGLSEPTVASWLSAKGSGGRVSAQRKLSEAEGKIAELESEVDTLQRKLIEADARYGVMKDLYNDVICKHAS